MAERKRREARKHDILEAVWSLIETGGIEAVTVRAIAQESGWSTGSLAHYFVDKEDILTSALRLSHEEIRRRRDTSTAELPPAKALREFVLDNLPLDERRRRETILEISYWGRAVSDEHTQQIQRQESSVLKSHLMEIIHAGVDAGELEIRAEEQDDAAERILALIDGLSLHMVLYPHRFSAEQAQRIAERELASLMVQG